MVTGKDKALEVAIGQIEKQFGRGAIMKLGQASATLAVESIPTGSIALDLALGIGGIPRGRVSEIFGPEASGKSTLAQHIIAEAQKLGGTGWDGQREIRRPMLCPLSYGRMKLKWAFIG
jgi:recombination protein RecA